MYMFESGTRGLQNLLRGGEFFLRSW